MKSVNLIRKLFGISVVTRSRLGFLIAVVVLVTIGEKAAIAKFEALQPLSPFICIGVAVAGFLSWGAGRWAEARRAGLNEDQDVPLEEVAAEHPLAFLHSGKYWGMILILSAAMLTCVLACPHPQPALSVRARPQLTLTNSITITNVVTITNAPPVVSFPPLKLAGVVINGAKSSALINGRVLQVGEGIGKVLLVAVEADHATVALEGQTKVLTLRK
jgi:hypothetical protein